ncbi:MAG: ATP-binding protein [Candidatus Dadabacteria bacterium]|nr:MAG: ATP-binding protein [Candidatus Dadabacteria bacterium]
MFERKITEKLKGYVKTYRAVCIVGPRQSGKTTLVRHVFNDYQYCSLENPDTRKRAIDDPRSFLASFNKSAILDEIQYVPDLFSYLQEILDDSNDQRNFILTGSNSFQLNEKISQSLAGRVRIATLLPLLNSELPEKMRTKDLDQLLYSGSYPRIYDKGLNPTEWYADYYNTYVQKDVRTLLNVSNLNLFDTFTRLCAGRTGNLADYSSIASEAGITQPTAVRWASVLEASFLIFRLKPHFVNFNKRIIKSPKIYFFDTGLLCYLLHIRTKEHLFNHPLRGAIFENWVIAEIHKAYFAKGLQPPLYFWRDQHGHEVDLVVDNGSKLHPLEIKCSATFNSHWLKTLNWFNKLQNYNRSHIIYAGDENFTHGGSEVLSYNYDFCKLPWR